MKDANLVVRIPSAKKKELQAHAEKNGLTTSSLVSALIDEELRRPQSLSNMYGSITKKFEDVDQNFKVLAKTADGNFGVLSKHLERQFNLIEKVEDVNEKFHKSTWDVVKSYGAMLKSVAEILAKLQENSVTKDQLERILVRLLAKEGSTK